MKKRTLLAASFTLALLFSALAASMHFEVVQAATDVSGIINSDTTWTKANSPYNLAGNVLVENGVTLTIEAGATVNLNSYYIRVNGTLTARGNPTNKITFNGGQITFTTVSNPWNEQTNSGCIIENAIIYQTSISSSYHLKIDNCIINGEISVTSSIISNNVVTGTINCDGSTISNNIVTGNIGSHTSIISDNNVKGDIVLGSVTLGAITAPAESSTVSGNIVEGYINSGSPQGTPPQIFNNTVSKVGIGCTGHGSIFNNYVHDCNVGISLYSVRVFGGYLACDATVENNVVADNTNGISIGLDSLDGSRTAPTILNNTITRNSIGISLSESNYDATPMIRYNNLQNNSNYNFYLAASNNIDASYNWWGTTDESAISQSIYDFKNDFNLGTVSFQPILTSPNSNTPAPSTPTPTPTHSPSTTPSPATTPTPTPSTEPQRTEQPEIIIGVAIAVAVIGAGLGLLIYLIKRK